MLACKKPLLQATKLRRAPCSARQGLSKRYGRLYSTSTNTPPTPESAKDRSKPLFQRLTAAFRDTPTKWYPLPLAAGALLLLALNYRKNHLGKGKEPEVQVGEDGTEVVRLKGPWQVHVLGALPLRNLSRLWGYLNALELPIWFRPFGFKLYAFIFGCNLEEINPDDLTQYRSLGEFFYRRLKEGARPVDEDAVLVSPADGKVLHFGTISDTRIEQVKGITYSLDALLGVSTPISTPPASPTLSPRPDAELAVVDDQEFANVNGIEYTLGELLGSSASKSAVPHTDRKNERPPSADRREEGAPFDASVGAPSVSQDTSVALEMGVRPSLSRRPSIASGTSVKPSHALYFIVIYLAPGDYHRFHSPAAWVVERRRHFVGELFSVSPYMAKRLEGLFVLNERVALMGRWRYGFFGMVPVGATNVGSIKINFDTELRTNLANPHSSPPPGTYTEAIYTAASPVLRGQPLRKAEEMGGFCLGSTIVLVFEAPKNWRFDVAAGDKVKVGQKLGDVVEET